jgi:alginate O-acetyltransferase complex protein AlgI
MSFNSIAFLVFISLFFLLWPFVKKKQNPKYLYLIASSFVFYGWWDWRFLFLIVFSGLVDYFSAIIIEKQPKRAKFYLILSLCVNLLSLSVFKYSTFIVSQIETLFQFADVIIDLKKELPPFTLILPVGISFYTFQSMSYTIDVYNGKLKPTNNILHFFSYLVMFPQLVAGPIVRAKDFLHQLTLNRKISGLEFWNGIKLILLGYFQKTVLADNLGVLVDTSFAGVDNLSGVYWWIVITCFAFQIYFDFSGYTQIARGLAKLMGYHFRMNFNHPYLATSLKDFWSRWHISLSSWFRDYIYIPLGGSKLGRFRSNLNMWITMFLSGLWHGAALNFILWGLYHAAMLSVERLLKGYFGDLGLKYLRPFGWGITMIQVLIGWVFFRATSMDQIKYIFQNMFLLEFDLSFIGNNINVMVFLILAIFYESGFYLAKKVPLVKNRIGYQMEVIFYAAILASVIFFRGPEKEFIYFQF